MTSQQEGGSEPWHLTGEWHRQSNYGRNVRDPAAAFVEWPRNHDDRGWLWTFRLLRHVFATWAFSQPSIRVEDVSELMAYSSIGVTQEIYMHVSSDVFDRFYDPAGGGAE